MKTIKHLSSKDTAFSKDLQQEGHLNYPLNEKAVKREHKSNSITSRFCCSFLSMSIDTIHIELPKQEIKELVGMTRTINENGEIEYECGYMKCIKIRQYPKRTRVECSLPKLLIGNNVFCLSHSGLITVIKLLEDQLGISLQNGIIRRLDLFVNIATKNPPQSYFMFLGDSPYFYKCTTGGTSLYFKNKNRELCIYDKIQEMRDKRTDIPDICVEHLMRIEYRLKNTYLKRLFDNQYLYIKDLFSKEIMMILINNFEKVYLSIFKLKKPLINFGTCLTKKEFQNCLMNEGIRSIGGINTIFEMIESFKLRQPNLRKEFFSRLKKGTKDISKMNGFSIDNDCIIEVDEKFKRGYEEFKSSFL